LGREKGKISWPNCWQIKDPQFENIPKRGGPLHWKIQSTAFTLALLITPLFAQQRFGDEYRQLKGFTKSPTEHIMSEYEGVPEVRSVSGRIIDSSGAGIPDATFEIRKEDPEDQIRGVLTNDKGRFHLRSIHDGIYVFKATKNGFQSVIGKLKVNGKTLSRGGLEIWLPIGV
jgi:hypothetical protein